MRQGLAPAEARRRAQLDLGGEEPVREEHRDSRGTALLEDAIRDLHGALRQARRAPGVVALAVVCLGLGVGVNTAISASRTRCYCVRCRSAMPIGS